MTEPEVAKKQKFEQKISIYQDGLHEFHMLVLLFMINFVIECIQLIKCITYYYAISNVHGVNVRFHKNDISKMYCSSVN